MQGLKSLAWHILLHCLSSAIFLYTPITQTSNLQVECQENATLVAEFFSRNKIISSQQFIHQVQFSWTCALCAVYFIMCQYDENLSVKMELHYVSSPTNHIRIRRVSPLYLYKKSQRGLVLMFLSPPQWTS